MYGNQIHSMKAFLCDFYLQESCVELKRDTEREEEIKSIKNAWETHEPGRAAKVLKINKQQW